VVFRRTAGEAPDGRAAAEAAGVEGDDVVGGPQRGGDPLIAGGQAGDLRAGAAAVDEQRAEAPRRIGGRQRSRPDGEGWHEAERLAVGTGVATASRSD
jgi:hypothetical protein